MDVPVGQALLCSGRFTFTQDIMEEGPVKQLTATVNTKATDTLVAIPAPAGVTTQVGVPVSIAPRMNVDVLDTGCIKPYRAGALAHTCTGVAIKNSAGVLGSAAFASHTSDLVCLPQATMQHVQSCSRTKATCASTRSRFLVTPTTAPRR